MSKYERKIIIGLFATCLFLVFFAGGLSYSIDYDKHLQVVRSNTKLTVTALMNDVSLTWEAKSQD